MTSFVGFTPGNTLKLGIIGFPNIGKTTLFNILTCPEVKAPTDDFLFTTLDCRFGHFSNPDERLVYLADIFKAKVAPNEMVSLLIDGPGIVAGSVNGAGEGLDFLEQYRQADVLIHVLRSFEDLELTHYNETIDPTRDLEVVTQELMQRDLITIENKIVEIYGNIDYQKHNHMTVGKNMKWDLWILEKAWGVLVGEERELGDAKAGIREHEPMPPRCSGASLRLHRWSALEIEVLTRFNLFTCKPVVYVLNGTTREFLRSRALWQDRLQARVEALGGGSIVFASLVFEQKIVDLRRAGLLEEYMRANPTHASCIPALRYNCQRSLDLITFYTATLGAEVKPWRCRQGTQAQDASGLINTEWSRNFSKADTYSYDDLVEYKGDFDRLFEFGKHRTNTKRYEIIDGDVIEFVAYAPAKNEWNK